MATALGEPGLRVQEASHQGRSRRSHECSRAHCGERGSLVLSSEDERLRLSLLAFGVSSRPGSEAGRERYEQLLAAAKRASARLDEYGPKLEQFSNQPKR